MKNLLISSSLALLSLNTFAATNMSYVEVNSNKLSNVGCYIDADSGEPFFGITSIFAGNINGSTPNSPQIYFNDNVKNTLATTQVSELQKKGIKVLMTLLGNHDNAGWSCMTDQKAAKQFAAKVVGMVNKYKLDGVDIDDEYSACTPNDTSMIMIAQAIKTDPRFKGKLLTKALFDDENYFTATYQGHSLSEYLDYGWEMSYSDSDFKDRLQPYLANGMTRDKLMLGGWTQDSSPTPYSIGNYTEINSLPGAMIYDIKSDSQVYLSHVADGEEVSDNVSTLQNCLN